ncbi:HAD family hydrolase [Bradyrhizobium sp. WD16]|uniref:HAD family hydrolase n=1 Tax=Bradyrhizobium sp. WD16 TaxID=1521768 RepID=UPI0020A5F9EA|nr:HAD family hydrolase [Bradyrhizobium sp. WD16]UTD25896.1 HAD family hydrolase [Bradyrhizobium sp. WD16]
MTTIYFDLDGTLTDSRPGIARSIQHALERLGHPVPAAEELTWCLGPPLQQSLKTLLGTEALVQAALLHYRERFAEVGLFENEVYTGIEDVLAALKADGRRLFFATSKPHVYAERIIGHFGLDKYFDRVFGAELDGTRADKTDLLAYALAQTRTDPAQALMIGDRSHDIIGARNNAMAAVGVLYGYGSREGLLEAGPERLCATPQELGEHA